MRLGQEEPGRTANYGRDEERCLDAWKGKPKRSTAEKKKRTGEKGNEGSFRRIEAKIENKTTWEGKKGRG